jgi:hypothetical protein
MTKVYKYYKPLPKYSYELDVITRSPEIFKREMIKRIEAGDTTYDPWASHPSKEKAIARFTADVDEGREYFPHFDGYAEKERLRLKTPQERYMYLMSCLQEHYEEACSLGHEVFAVVLQGSQNYDMDLYTEEYCSDVDTKCIVLPTPEEMIRGLKPVSETHERANKEHIDLKDIRLMFECFRKQNVNYVEILFSDFYYVPDKYKHYWEALKSLAEDIVHAYPSQLLKTMSGMSMEKLKALKHPYPSLLDKIEKYGYDPKQAHTIVRMNDFVRRYLMGLSFKESMQPSSYIRKKLFDLKLGKYSLVEVETLCKDIDAETKKLKDDYIEENGEEIQDSLIFSRLDNIKVEVLTSFFKEVFKEC